MYLLFNLIRFIYILCYLLFLLCSVSDKIVETVHYIDHIDSVQIKTDCIENK